MFLTEFLFETKENENEINVFENLIFSRSVFSFLCPKNIKRVNHNPSVEQLTMALRNASFFPKLLLMPILTLFDFNNL